MWKKKLYYNRRRRISMIRRTFFAALALFCVAEARSVTRAQTRPAARPADVVLRDGKIVTVDDARPEAQALAISGDKIVAIGSTRDIQAYVGPNTKVKIGRAHV